MSAAPEHLRAARIAIPRLPLPAILVFAVAGLGGSLFLTYTSSFTGAEPIKAAASPADSRPIYSVPAVPFDSIPETVGERATPEAAAEGAIAGAQSAPKAPSETQRTETAESGGDSASSEPILFAEATRKFKGFNRFSESGVAANSVTLSETTFGMIAQSNAPAYGAPDSDAIAAPVPEPSTWLCGVALLALILTRGIHASWHRHQRRTTSKTHSARP
ncbi:MAG TPA: hypothetical protein VK474_03025 [Chthoniobacterales bacterium]|nr:hypothetical protein [Chthoniobacterales bacterium]